MDNIDISLLNTKIIWVTLINRGYVHYTKNFILSMKRANIQFKLIVFCLDEDAFSELKDNSQCICVMATFLPTIFPKDMREWGDSEYKKIVYAKLDVIAYTLKSTYDMGISSVGYIDTDIFLFSDPTPIMLREMDMYPNIDIFCQCDEESISCADRNKCLNICSGVFVVRNKKELYELFKYNESDIPIHDSDQHFLQDRLNKRSIGYRTIEKIIMRNGGFYSALHQWLRMYKISIDPSLCLIHFNYMKGHEKEECMRNQGLWLL